MSHEQPKPFRQLPVNRITRYTKENKKNVPFILLSDDFKIIPSISGIEISEVKPGRITVGRSVPGGFSATVNLEGLKDDPVLIYTLPRDDCRGIQIIVNQLFLLNSDNPDHRIIFRGDYCDESLPLEPDTFVDLKANQAIVSDGVSYDEQSGAVIFPAEPIAPSYYYHGKLTLTDPSDQLFLQLVLYNPRYEKPKILANKELKEESIDITGEFVSTNAELFIRIYNKGEETINLSEVKLDLTIGTNS